MKRARNKKRSLFLGRRKQPEKAHIDFELTPSEFEPEPDTTDETAEFAVPDEVLQESLIERDYTAEDVMAEEFAVSEDELEESLAERDYTAEDMAAEEFAVPDAELEESLIERDYTVEDIAAEEFAVSEDELAEALEDNSQSEYDDLPEEEIPFSTEDFTTDDIEDEPVISNAVTPAAHNSSHNKSAKEKKMRRRRTVTVCVSIFLLFIATAFALLGIDYSSHSGDDFLTPVDTATGKINVLLLGVDVEGERSDSIMLISYDFDTHAINLMSIPRDTKMYVTDRNVTRKITEVHGMHDSAGKMYGAAAVAESVTSLTGIPINYYLEFSFTALDNVMDILGPVTFDVPDIEGGGRGMNYDDDWQGLHIHLKPGVQELSGNQIQQFLRYRKSNYGVGDGSDTSRIGRQQELLKAIIDQKLNISFILKVPDIFKEIKSQLKTNFTLKDVIKYAGYLKDISSDNMTTYVLPGESVRSGAWYHVCDFDQTSELVTTVFEYEVTADELTNEISLSGKKATGKTNTQKSETKTDSTSKADSTNNKTEENSSTKSSGTSSSSNSSSDSSTIGQSNDYTSEDNSADVPSSPGSSTVAPETDADSNTPVVDEDDSIISLD